MATAKRRKARKLKRSNPTPRIASLLYATEEIARDADYLSGSHNVLWRIERVLIDIRDELRSGRRFTRRRAA